MTEKYLSQQKVTLAVINAKIWTANPLKPLAEAISVSGNLITTVDSNKEVRKLLNKNTLVIDAKGQILIPGFTDSHLHFIEGGLRLKSVQLRDARTPEDFIARIKAFDETIKPGTWITGGDWDHEQWGGELPCRDWIDKVTPNNPIWINRLDGHMALANSIALKAANITKDTPDIKGGTIVRSSNGEPTGIFKDNAMKLITRIIPEPSEEMKNKALKSAMQYVAKHGVTSVHNMGTWNELEIFERAHNEGKLHTRISAAVPLETWEQLY
ncbi:MAG: amidohydrolase family protein, partial [Candidatus Marinimicrobia bacterium]|nr:amidohydrolase family protein [Candidatus Neomarinimicrobiota bacterium]